MIRHPALSPVQGRQKYTRLAAYALGYQILLFELALDGPVNDRPWDLQELSSGRDQAIAFRRAVTLR